MDFGLSHSNANANSAIIHNFLEEDDIFDSYLYSDQNKVYTFTGFKHISKTKCARKLQM